jgi:hypothetical protein
MQFEEFKGQLDRLTGKTGRGWKRLAAEALGVTERALYDAEKRGEAGPVLVRAMRAALERKKNWAPLTHEAGRWLVGTIAGSADGVEVLVVHLESPALTALFRFKPDMKTERLVKEHDEADVEVLLMTVDAAEAMATQHVRAAQSCAAEPEGLDAKPSSSSVKRRRLARSDIERIRSKPKTECSGRGQKPGASNRASGKGMGLKTERSGEVSEADASE